MSYKEISDRLTGKRKKTHKESCKKYEKKITGYRMRMYRNMKSRVTGIQYKKAHLYEGLELMAKEDFYEWIDNNKDYKKLHKEWVDSGYDRRLSPSIDRINSDLGYIRGNIRVITHSENSRLGSLSRSKKSCHQD